MQEEVIYKNDAGDNCLYSNESVYTWCNGLYQVFRSFGECDRCGYQKKLLRFDGSAEEYYSGSLCLDCIIELFNK